LRIRCNVNDLNDFYEGIVEGEQYKMEREKRRTAQICAVCGGCAKDLQIKYLKCKLNVSERYDTCNKVAAAASIALAAVGSLESSVMTPVGGGATLTEAVAFYYASKAICQKTKDMGDRYCERMNAWCANGGKGPKPTHWDDRTEAHWPGNQYVMPESIPFSGGP
jgi:hypothetical protein